MRSGRTQSRAVDIRVDDVVRCVNGPFKRPEQKPRQIVGVEVALVT
ncbi:MAG: hypothetical protein ACK6AO_01245 [Planctomycetota bacterium]